MRFPFEKKLVFSGKPLVNSGVNTFRTELPITGENIERIRLIFAHTIAGKDGSGPKSMGAVNVVKNIKLITGKGDIIVDASGRALYYLNYKNEFSEPVYDSFSANGTVYYICDIPFHFNKLVRPEDLYFYTGYATLELSITMGDISDFWATLGSQTLSSTLDIVFYTSKASLSTTDKIKALPVALPYIKQLPQVNLTNQNYVQLESAKDLALIGFVGACLTSPTAGFDGTYADNIKSLSFYDNIQFFVRQAPLKDFVAERKRVFGSNLTGIYTFDFVRTGSIMESYATGEKSDIKIYVDNFQGTSYLDVLLYGFRKFKF